jgi:hypothetical protein
MMRGRHSLAAAALIALALVARGAAADPVAIRAAAHDGFGRIAFDWPDPVSYEAKIAGDTLTIKFARPLQGAADQVSRRLAGYIASATLADDGKTLVAHLKRPVTVTAFTVKQKTIVVDLTPVVPHKAEPKPVSAKPDPKPAAAARQRPAPPVVPVEVVDKNGVAHVTFAWPKRVEYGLAEKDGVAHLTFRAAGAIDETALAALAPKIETTDRATTVSLAIAPGTHAKVARAGDKVVLEFHRPPAPKLASPAVAAAAPPPPPSAPVAIVPPTPEPDAPPAPPPATVAVHYAATDTTASLRFDWPVVTAAAVFRRDDTLWVVFALPTALDLAEPQAQGQQTVTGLSQLATKDATVLRLTLRQGLAPAVRRAGTAWIVDLKPQAVPAEAPIAIEAHPDASPANVAFRVHQAAEPVKIADPEIGRLTVVPVGELGRGIDAPQTFVDFRTLPSVQGIVLRLLSDDAALHVSADDVEVARPGGLELSSERDRLLNRRAQNFHVLFDFDRWMGSRNLDYVERRAALERAITTAPAGALTQPRLALAHFYFAHFFGAETLAVLDAIAHDDPPALDDPAVHALKGAACVLVAELKCAADELGQHALDNEPEAALWRASLASANGDADAAAKGFLTSANLLPLYPRELRLRFALEAAAAMLDTGQPSLSRPLLDLVLRDKAAPRDEMAMAQYLDGRRLKQDGRLDDALKEWSDVAATNAPEARARALYSSALALMDAGKATRPDTIKALDGLRFAWRGDDFEFSLLRKLGELQLAEGDDGAALESLHTAAVNFPDDRAIKDVVKETSDAFASIFLDDKDNNLPPLKALALYDQFYELEPAGERSDRIVKKLIDRLVSVDLLDRAADLLDEQVQKRPAGSDKARGATQLALLRLMDHEPDAAMKALDIDVGQNLPADLARQRQQLRARVLMEQSKPDDALKLIAGDDSRDADRLRADIFWRRHDWKQAATTLERLAGAPPADGKIDADTGRLIVSLAAALTLDDDQTGVQKLRAAFGPSMANSAYTDAFRVLVGDGAAAPGADPQAIAVKIAQLGELQNFMSSLKQKIASAGKAPAVN